MVIMKPQLAKLRAVFNVHLERIEQEIIRQDNLIDISALCGACIEGLIETSDVWYWLEDEMESYWPEYHMCFMNGDWWDVENTPEGWEQIRQILAEEADEPINHPESV